MLTDFLLLAQTATPEEQIEALKNKDGSPLIGGETGLILGAVLVLVALLFFWAFFLRKRPQTQRGSFVLERAQRENPERYGASGRRRRRKRKVDHPDNMPRNPTLSEIGGLPPLRPDEPEPPAADDGSPPSPQPQR